MASQAPLIVVGVDGSELSKKALEWALAHAERTGGRLKAVVAWHYPVMYGASPMISDWNPEDDARKVAAAVLDEGRPAHPGVDVELLVVEGVAAEMLAAQSRGADLVVVGAKGHNAASRLFLGSTSTQLVSHAECSVVVVR